MSKGGKATTDSSPKWHEQSNSWRKRITINGKQKTYHFRYPKNQDGRELAIEDWRYTLSLIRSTDNPTSSAASLYLIKCGDCYKIGISSNVAARLAALQSSNPQTLKLAATSKAANALYVEQWLHDCFRSKRIRGEWFKLSAAEVDAVCLIFNASDAA
jgi:hypothetical protein